MAPDELTLEKLFLILRARSRLIAVVLTAAMVVAATITVLMPKKYTATTSLNFTFHSNPMDKRSERELAEATYVATQIGIIESQQVAQRVEDSLTEYERERLIAALDANYTVIDELASVIKSPIYFLFNAGESSVDGPDSGNGEALEISSAYSWLAQGLGGDNLVVEPEVDTRIVEISYEATDPQVAALMANKFAEAYIATNLQMVTDPARKSKAWIDEQLQSLRKRLEEAQSKLTVYQQQEKVISTDERLDTESTRLQNLSSQLVSTQEATRNAVTQRQKLQEVLASGRSLTTFEPVFNNPVVQSIKANIRDLEGALVNSSNALGANHPKIRKLKSEIYAARQRLETEIKTITDGINNAAELSSERERDLEKSLEAQKQLVLKLKDEHDKIAVLQREVVSTQATYNAALEALNTTSIQSVIEQTNVSIVDYSNIPSHPSSPRVVVNLALGMLGGLILGIGLAVILEISIRRVHSQEDLTVELGVPLLAHLKKV